MSFCNATCPIDVVDGVRRPRVTERAGTVDSSGCVCRDGLYLKVCADCALGNECLDCPDHAICEQEELPGVGVTLEKLRLEKGWVM